MKEFPLDGGNIYFCETIEEYVAVVDRITKAVAEAQAAVAGAASLSINKPRVVEMIQSAVSAFGGVVIRTGQATIAAQLQPTK
jgi:hypothetical protein